jgi:hypothetical protein
MMLSPPTRTRALPWWAAVPLALVACAPPPLPEDGTDLPSIRFVFPQSELDGVVCPDFLAAVSIENFEVVPPDGGAAPVDGMGHWHLDDPIDNEYYPLEEPFVDLTARMDGESSRAYQLTASLVNINHSPLDQGEFPASVATVEFTVADVPDCVGGGGASARR